MAGNTSIVHVTHEAVGKIGGIGTVLEGFFTCRSYLDAVERSILVGPLFTTEGTLSDRLGENSEVLYSSLDGFANTAYASAFLEIENFYNVSIVYGKRTFVDDKTGVKSSPEVVLIDVRNMEAWPVNKFKQRLYDDFGIKSDLYENVWDYEQYVRLAPPTIDILKTIGAATDSTTIISHEYMGMPTALAGIIEAGCNFKAVFYAHEVATMRRIVESHPGHDTMFYNVVKEARANKLYVNEVFGDQSNYFKHALVEAAKYCDCILAVGDYVVDEFKFLGPEFENANIDIVYNGIPAYQICLDEKQKSRGKLEKYCEILLGYRPDFIFTHVTRMVKSKGLWRDLYILDKIEKEFRELGKTGVMFLLSTETAKRHSRDIYRMESEYDWPVAHREGMPDLSGGEARFYAQIQEFNAKSRNIKVIFLNQFGFNQASCGSRMPEDMEFMDIRRGSDVEFGMSVYEPFGISQLEPLSFGGICVVSNVCGCAGFVRNVSAGRDLANVIEADYTQLNGQLDCDGDYRINNLLDIGESVREEIEEQVSGKIAKQIIQRLIHPQKTPQKMIQAGYKLAKNMSWEAVVKNHLLISLQKIRAKQTGKYICSDK